MDRNWQHTNYYRRSPWRWLRDLFDDTMYLRRGLRRIKQNTKRQKQEMLKANIPHDEFWQKLMAQPMVDEEPKLKPRYDHEFLGMQLPKKPEGPPVRSVREGIDPELPQEYHKNPLPSERRFIESKKIEDYAAAATENVQVVTVPVPQMYFIPIPQVKFKIERNRKIIKINLPKIKINMTMLKRWAFVSIITSSAIVAIAALIMFSRFIALTDGDFIGETYRYKMEKFHTDVAIPIIARIENVEKRMTEMEAKKEFKEFQDLTGYKPPQPKIIKVYKYYKNKKEPDISTYSK